MTRPVATAVLCALSSVASAMACQLDSSGSGFPEGASVAEGPSPTSGSSGGEDSGDPEDAPAADDDGEDEGETRSGGDEPSNPETTRGAGDDETSTADDADDGDRGEVDSDDGAEAGDDDGADVCPADVQTIYWVADAEVSAPMMLVPSDAMGEPEVAVSEVAESGEVVVTIDLPCAGQYSVWGLVWDLDPGAWASPDPDSLWVDLGGGETLWRYGCQTTDVASGLSWQQLSSLAGQPCDLDYLVVEASEPGSYEIRFRNREAGDASQVAGIAAIAVLSDVDGDPAAMYEPY